jgi:hypothetical protein
MLSFGFCDLFYKNLFGRVYQLQGSLVHVLFLIRLAWPKVIEVKGVQRIKLVYFKYSQTWVQRPPLGP